MSTRVLAWGLSPDELETVYRYAAQDEVRIIDQPPASLEAPLLVGVDTLPELAAWAEQYDETGIRPRPILLSLLAGGEEPAGMWDTYDGVVSRNDTRTLERLMRCPQSVEAQIAAADVPAAFLAQLSRPVRLLRIAEIPFENPEWHAADSDMRRHLSECATCRRAFNEALEWQIDAPQRLIEQACRTWLDILVELGTQAVAESQEARKGQLVWAVVHAILTRHLSPWQQVDVVGVREAGGRSGDAAASQTELTANVLSLSETASTAALEEFAETAQEGFQFESEGTRLVVKLNKNNLWINPLLPYAREPRSFRLALMRDGSELWSAASQSGQVTLPLEVLEGALANGPVHIVMQLEPEE